MQVNEVRWQGWASRSQGVGGTARGQLRSLVCLWDSVLGLCDTVSPSVPQRPSRGRGHPVPLGPHHLLGSLSGWHVPAPGGPHHPGRPLSQQPVLTAGNASCCLICTPLLEASALPEPADRDRARERVHQAPVPTLRPAQGAGRRLAAAGSQRLCPSGLARCPQARSHPGAFAGDLVLSGCRAERFLGPRAHAITGGQR